MKNIILNFMKAKKDSVSYLEIEKLFEECNFDYKGNTNVVHPICRHLIFWTGWSEEAVNLIYELIEEGSIQYIVGNVSDYVLSGKFNKIPRNTRKCMPYTEHWSPSAFRLREVYLMYSKEKLESYHYLGEKETDNESPALFLKMTPERQKELLGLIAKYLTPIKSFNTKHTSYGLKHRFEKFMKLDKYISNAEMKGAMIISGYKIKDDRDQNHIYNISNKFWEVMVKDEGK